MTKLSFDFNANAWDKFLSQAVLTPSLMASERSVQMSFINEYY